MNTIQAKKERAILKARITRLQNDIKAHVLLPKTPENIQRMNSLFDRASEAYNKYTSLQNDIMVYVSEDCLKNEEDDYAKIENQYIDVKTAAILYCRHSRSSSKASQFSSSTSSNITVKSKQASKIGSFVQRVKSFIVPSKINEPNEDTIRYNDFNPTTQSSIFHGFPSSNSDRNQQQLVPDAAIIPEVVNAAPISNEVDNALPTIQQATSVDKYDKLIEIISSNIAAQAITPQLPPIKFSGEATDWPEFRDIFIGIAAKLHNDADRLLTLKAACKDGSASRLVKYFSTANDYALAWSALEAEYDQEKLALIAHIQKFLHQKAVPEKATSQLRSLYTTSDTVIRQLKAMKYESRDLWLITILLEKLDTRTVQAWSFYSNTLKLPTIDDFLVFLSTRCKALEVTSTTNDCYIKPSRPLDKSSRSRRIQSHHTKQDTTESSSINFSYPTQSTNSSSSAKCIKCKSEHWLYQCPSFTAMTPAQRHTFVTNNNLCINCLRKHQSTCPSRFTCKHCNQRHHSLLHSTTNMPTYVSSVANLHDFTNNGLLPTALAIAKASDGSLVNVRILLDTGSSTSFISESLVQLLRLKRHHSIVPVSGTGDTISCSTKGSTLIEIQSCIEPAQSIMVQVNVLQKVTGLLPPQSYDTSTWTHLTGLQLADPTYSEPNRIDMILGSQYLVQTLKEGLLKASPGSPDAINSIFGWLVIGDTGRQAKSVVIDSPHQKVISHHAELDTYLKQFWEIEDVPTIPLLSKEEEAAENHFVTTHAFNNNRFTVRLPFKSDAQKLGNSFYAAHAQALSEERRCERNPAYKQLFHEFMNDIANRGHWEEVPASELEVPNDQCYYMKRHGVLKESSTTTKLRVVVNASSPTSNGTALNDILMLGAKQQHESLDILLRHRTYKFVFTTDIEKMYRMVNLHPADTNFQRILWRTDPNEQFKHYRLTTVIYGTRSASFLATRCLTECAKMNESIYPQAARTLLQDTYVDDISSGDNDFDTCRQLMADLKQMLASCGFNARKWTANHPELLTNISPVDREIDLLELGPNDDTHLKLLGVLFDPRHDKYLYQVKIEPAASCTRRTMLSELARIYDPFGGIQPVIVIGKCLMQQAWMYGTEWDQLLPDHIQNQWKRLCSEFYLLNQVNIERFVPNYNGVVHLHAFCDASEKAYCTVIYAFSDPETSKNITGNFLIAKTKVAPIKPTSIARLELCAAVLLCKVVQYVVTSFQHLQVQIYAYTDSTTVLTWLSHHPSRWKTFVAHRVAAITDVIPPSKWSYVPSKQNPADIGSRGLYPSELVECTQWFKGPDWLYGPKMKWPISRQEDLKSAMTEARKSKVFLHQTTSTYPTILNIIIDRNSNYHRMVIVMSLVLQAVHKFKMKKTFKSTQPYVKSPIQVDEFCQAELTLFKMVQQQVYSKEIAVLQSNEQLHSSSTLVKLHPFVDANQLLRVGGRLQHSHHATYDSKHPIILPGKHQLVIRMTEYLHRTHQHAGTNLLTNILYQRFWIINARMLVKNTIFHCLRCYILKRRTAKQLMGTLPECRVNQNPAFLHVGVDYAGPFIVRMFRIRKAVELKIYVALYVCMVTKAVHLEISEDLSTEGFLATFSRFVSTRGLPTDIYSDQGTNFIGANHELRTLFQMIYNDKRYEEYMLQRRITWHFNPPSSPHHGGLWESNVKSMKQHFKKLFGETKLSIMEFQTVMKNVEACLNSRPLFAQTHDVDDLDPLTPGHFLIGRPLLSIPQRDYTVLKSSRLKSFDLIKKLTDDFWYRWRNEYLHTLQERPKWQRSEEDLKEGDLVVMMVENSAPTVWPLARIVKTYPDAEGQVRVVELKTSKSTYKRSVQKLIKLPIESTVEPSASTGGNMDEQA